FLRRGVTSVRDVYDVAYGDDGWSGDYDPYSTGGAAEMRPAAGPEPVQASPPVSGQPEEELPPADRLPAAEDFGPMEEAPLSEPSAGATYNEFGEVISYNEPVDSQPRSRKLGKPPQSRLVR
ncbi:MAG TPA: hypothetical protein VHV08_08965, partial [Pirellulales bacterium]|nr:hypothetical protein [Pirellulales bacterium]